MIDFSKITKTTKGLDCYYFGQRTSGAQVVYRFVVFNNASEVICYYNEQGDEIEFSAKSGKWQLTGGYPIIPPPKIVEVTRWVGLSKHSDFSGDGYLVAAFKEVPDSNKSIIAWTKHTFRFEVPNE